MDVQSDDDDDGDDDVDNAEPRLKLHALGSRSVFWMLLMSIQQALMMRCQWDVYDHLTNDDDVPPVKLASKRLQQIHKLIHREWCVLETILITSFAA